MRSRSPLFVRLCSPHLSFVDTRDSFVSIPPEYVADYLMSPELVALNEDDQYKFSNLAESRQAIKAANVNLA